MMGLVGRVIRRIKSEQLKRQRGGHMSIQRVIEQRDEGMEWRERKGVTECQPFVHLQAWRWLL